MVEVFFAFLLLTKWLRKISLNSAKNDIDFGGRLKNHDWDTPRNVAKNILHIMSFGAS